MTLSHVWGGYMPIELTKGSIDDLVRGVSLDTMPQTFRDAAIVCLSLSVKYLWIDSLCIMQDKDDLSDWARESMLMSEVYSNSYCTLGATAPNCSYGLFRRRDPGDCGVAYSPVNGQPDQYLYDEQLWRKEVDASILGTRGWVAQEQVLSTRILYFGRSQLFWQCSSAAACEVFPQTVPKGVTDLSLQPSLLRERGASRLATKSQMYTGWNKFVTNYSSRLLTNSGDRLVALAGVAQSMSRVLDDQYVAGLWTSQLPRALIWSVNTHKRGRVRAEYTAPTFSWASVDASIYIYDSVFKSVWEGRGPCSSVFEVVDVVIESALSEFGSIQGGFVRVKTRLRSYCSQIFQGCLQTLDEIERPYVFETMDDQFEHGTAVDDPREEELRTKTLYYGSGFPAVETKQGETVCLHLLLEHCGSGAFERVGILKVIHNESFHRLEEQYGVSEEAIPCESYDASQHLHTFRIL
jgi:hypothetical protein